LSINRRKVGNIGTELEHLSWKPVKHVTQEIGVSKETMRIKIIETMALQYHSCAVLVAMRPSSQISFL
jgi:hypothetical protein